MHDEKGNGVDAALTEDLSVEGELQDNADAVMTADILQDDGVGGHGSPDGGDGGDGGGELVDDAAGGSGGNAEGVEDDPPGDVGDPQDESASRGGGNPSSPEKRKDRPNRKDDEAVAGDGALSVEVVQNEEEPAPSTPKETGVVGEQEAPARTRLFSPDQNRPLEDGEFGAVFFCQS